MNTLGSLIFAATVAFAGFAAATTPVGAQTVSPVAAVAGR